MPRPRPRRRVVGVVVAAFVRSSGQRWVGAGGPILRPWSLGLGPWALGLRGSGRPSSVACTPVPLCPLLVPLFPEQRVVGPSIFFRLFSAFSCFLFSSAFRRRSYSFFCFPFPLIITFLQLVLGSPLLRATARGILRAELGLRHESQLGAEARCHKS